MLGMGFEPMSSARKAKMIGRTTPTVFDFQQAEPPEIDFLSAVAI